MYKIFCVDLDGTLLNWKKSISKKDLNAILDLQKNGIKVLFCTGKSEFACQKYVDQASLKSFKGGIICFNGAKLIDYDNYNVSYNNPIKLTNLFEQINYLKKYFYLILYFDDKTFFSSKNFILKKFFSWKTNNVLLSFSKLKSETKNSNLMKILLVSKFLCKKKKKIIKDFSEKNNLTYIFNNLFTGEINNYNVNKKEALITYCNFYSIKPEEIVACGNGINDIEMLKYAKCSIAPKNSSKEVKKIASFITFSNNKSGIAHGIKTIFKKL